MTTPALTPNGHVSPQEVAELRAHLDGAVRTIAEMQVTLEQAGRASEEASRVIAQAAEIVGKAANDIIQVRDEIRQELQGFRAEIHIVAQGLDFARAEAIRAAELAHAALKRDTIPADAPTPKPWRADP
jgi:hypothetical protein